MQCGERVWCELLLEIGGPGLEVGLTVVVSNCGDLALTRVLGSLMLQFLGLVRLQYPALLMPPIICFLGYAHVTGRINNILTLCNQHVNLLHLRGHIFRLVSLSRDV
jgi:hypothetical protein